MKKTLKLDSEVQNEFHRQRDHFEKLLTETKSKQVKKKSDPDTAKLLKENVTLITELNRLREELKDALEQNSKIQTVLGLSGRFMLPAVARKKLDRAITVSLM